MLSVYWRRPEVAEEEMQSCPGELGGRQGRGEQYGTIFPMGAAGSRPAGPELSWGTGWPPREGSADGCIPMGVAGHQTGRSCRANAELPTTPIKDAAPPYISIGRGAKYIWIIT